MKPTLLLSVFLLFGCGGAVIIDDDDGPPAPPAGPEAPRSSGALAATAAWGELVMGSGLETGRCLAVQVDDAVALGLCDVGSRRGFLYDEDTRTLTNGGLCLDGGGAAVRMEACDGGTDQQWIHDTAGRLRTLPEGAREWACLHTVDRTQFPDARDCDSRAVFEQRWAIDPRRASIDIGALLDGSEPIASPVTLHPVAPVGAGAVPLLLSASGVPGAVVGRAGAGRVLAFGSDQAIRGSDPSDGWGRVWSRSLEWLGQDDDPVVALGPDSEGQEWLDALGATVSQADIATDALVGVDIYVVADRPEGGVTDAELEGMQAFLQGGGGILAVRDALPDGGIPAVDPVNEYRTSAAAAFAGIAWTRSTSGSTEAGVEIAPQSDPSPFHNLSAAVELANRGERGLEEPDFETWQAIRADSEAPGRAGTRVAPWSRLGAATDALRDVLGGLEISPEEPLDFGSGQLSDLVLRGDYVVTGSTDAADPRVHESSRSFPGEAAGAGTKAREARIDTFAPLQRARRSTGLYALPGTAVTVDTPTSALEAGLRVRIGSATADTTPGVGGLDPSSTPRFPRVWTGRRLDRATVSLSSPFGGLIYVEVPEGDGVGSVVVTISGAVEAPSFVHGETTDEAWIATVRDAPGARGEVGGDHLIVTASAELLRTLEAPSAVAAQFDAIVEAHETFAALTESRRSSGQALPFRIVTDPVRTDGLQDGRPFEAPQTWARGLLVLEFQLGNEALFAALTRLGERYREGLWAPGPWSGAMAYLAATYAFEEALDLPFSDAWQGNLNDISRLQVRDDWLADDGDGWDAGAVATLELFLLLREDFGWEPLLTVISDLRDLPGDQQPDGNAEKLHAWITGLSDATGVDVVGIFQAWRFPIDEATLTATEGYPEWSAWPRIEPPPEEDDEP